MTSKQMWALLPHADQKRLISAYGKRLEQDKMAKIGTIHQFQGVGFGGHHL